MANIMDYLVWRGDISLAYSPFNDLDSLALSLLSYLTFQDSGQLRDLAPTVPAVDQNQFAFVHECRSLLDTAAMTERFAGITIRHPIAVTDQDKDMQFAAVIYDLPDGSHYVAFRGTDSTLVGWREDFNMAFESPVPAQSAAVKYLQEASLLTDGPLYVGGHSKGGNLAIYAAAHVDPRLQSRIRAVYSFDGPGMDDPTMASEGYAAIASRIRSFIPQRSVVGMLMAYHPDYTVVRSDKLGLYQHDGFTWQVLGTNFIVVTELGISSQLVDQTAHAWLSQVSPEQRRIFVTTIFDLLASTGASTVKELIRDIPARIPAVIKGLQKVDAETGRMIIALLKQFVFIGASNVAELVRQRINSTNNTTTDGLPSN